MSKHTIRTIAAQISYEVIYKKSNLSEVFKQRLSSPSLTELKSSVKALCFTTIRFYLSLEDSWLQYIDKRPKDKMVRVILSQAMAELNHHDKPQHAVVNEAINTAKKLNKRWATGLINSCLRKATDAIDLKPSSDVSRYSHPQWWIDQLKQDWPNNWQQILTANNQKPPLWIRSKTSPTEELLPTKHEHINGAYKIQAQDITTLEAFKKGDISVQDASAQLAALIIDPQNNEKILDACAAPGGKTCHLLELNSHIKLDALELFQNRAKKISENLQRLNLQANVIVADTNNTDQWFEGQLYNKILLDAPCSASGILRRHPDIKYIRQAKDLDKICQDQQQLLTSVAKLLAQNGRLLYATCSIFDQENSSQIKKFLKSHPEFSEIKLNYPFATQCEYGIQILTGTEDMDGFYYCYLKKDDL